MELEYVVNEISEIAPRIEGIVLCKKSKELIIPSKSFETTLASIPKRTVIPMEGRVIIGTTGLTGVFGIHSFEENGKAESVRIIWETKQSA